MTCKVFLRTAVLLTVATAGLLFAGCKKDKNLSNISASNVVSSACNAYTDGAAAKDASSPLDSIAVHYVEGTLYVEHYNLTVSCGFSTVNVLVSTSGDTIRVSEQGTPENTDCFCYINNFFQIDSVPSGTYTLVIDCDAAPYQQTFNF